MPKKRKPHSFDLSLVHTTVPDDLDGRELFHVFFSKQAEENRKLYEETGNPLFVWKVIQLWFCPQDTQQDSPPGPSVLQTGLSLPDWVQDYIKETACKLVEKGMEEDYGAADVGRLLGFVGARGGGGASRRYHNKIQKHYLLDHLCSLLKSNPGLNVPAACDEIVKRFPSAMITGETLKKQYDESNRNGKI